MPACFAKAPVTRSVPAPQSNELSEPAPEGLFALLNSAWQHMEVGRYVDARNSVQQALALDTSSALAHGVASEIEFKASSYPRALGFIERAIELKPGVPKLQVRRANILFKLGYHEQALADCEAALVHDLDIDGFVVKAAILQALGRFDEALATLVFAETMHPSNTDLSIERAWLLSEIGRQEEALVLLGAVPPGSRSFTAALECRSFLSQPKLGDPDLAAMERLAEDADTPPKLRRRLLISIGRSYLDARDGEKAFTYLNRGNALKRQSINYDPTAEQRWFSTIKSVFSPELLERFPNKSPIANAPLFVFGMPRSGTTLVEQILASHPFVRGAGESPYLETLARSAIFARGVSGFAADNLAKCRDEYLKVAGRNLPPTQRFVDKTNSNIVYAGLISLMLPGSRMIHCRRSPLDTCLSCYSLHFSEGNEFSYHLGELGHYYSQYESIMQHWRELLPEHELLDVDYELLVTDTEAQIRRILDFCQLPWDDTCLRFYETKRAVSTSSMAQVRKPIYKSSLNRADLFRPWLGTLIDALAANGT